MIKDNKKNDAKKKSTKELINHWFFNFSLRLRNYFFTGVIVLIPIGFTLYI